jgi:hypothetical protein
MNAKFHFKIKLTSEKKTIFKIYTKSRVKNAIKLREIKDKGKEEALLHKFFSTS